MSNYRHCDICGAGTKVESKDRCWYCCQFPWYSVALEWLKVKLGWKVV